MNSFNIEPNYLSFYAHYWLYKFTFKWTNIIILKLLRKTKIHILFTDYPLSVKLLCSITIDLLRDLFSLQNRTKNYTILQYQWGKKRLACSNIPLNKNIMLYRYNALHMLLCRIVILLLCYVATLLYSHYAMQLPWNYFHLILKQTNFS